MSIYVTVLIARRFLKEGDNIKKGDIVEIIKEPDNKNDENAIMVSYNGKQVGYIANNKETTVKDGTLSATEIQDKFEMKAKAIIISDFIEDRGYMKVYLGKLMLENKKEISFVLTGGFSTYTGKRELLKDIEEGEKTIKLVRLKNGRIIGEYNGKPAGAVTANEETMEIIKNYLEDLPEVLAIANAKDMGNIICKLEAKKVVKTKRVKLEEILNNIIDKGINTKEEIDRKLEYLRRNKVSELDIALLFESYVEYPKEVQNRIPKKPKVLYVDRGTIVADTIAYINVKKNLLFEGDKGVGKNVLAETLAWLYNRPLYQFSLNSQHSNNSLLGGKTFKAPEEKEVKRKKKTAAKILTYVLRKFIGKDEKKDIEEKTITAMEEIVDIFSPKGNQELVFEASAILDAFTKGGILVLDEFNTALAHVMTMFHSLLDDRREIEVTGYGLVRGHKNFFAIATQNRNYQGTFETNEATADRFEPIIFPPLTSLVEMLKERVPGAGYEVLVMADNLYTTIKTEVETGTISNQVLSPRGFISACQVIVNGMPPKRAFEISIANRATNPAERNIIKNIIDLQIAD